MDPSDIFEAPTEIVTLPRVPSVFKTPADLIVIAGLTMMTIPMVLLGWNHSLVGMALGIPFVLVFPGYVYAELLKPDRTRRLAERLLWSIGLSVVLAVLGGFFLNFTPWGLQGGTWAVLLGTLILGGCALVGQRRHHTGINLQPILPWKFTFRQIGVMALLVLATAGSLAVSVMWAKQQPYPGFTQLWILPGAAANTSDTVCYGVTNDELSPTTYRLVVTEDGVTLEDFSDITLAVGKSWQTSLVIAVPSAARSSIIVTLYRVDAPSTPYRSVQLWLGVEKNA